MGNLTRRAAMIGAFASSAALAVPAVEAARPIMVKVASPTFGVPPEVMAAIKQWQSAEKAKDAALAAYSAASRSEIGRFSLPSSLPITHPARVSWMNADDDATEAKNRLLRLLNKLTA